MVMNSWHCDVSLDFSILLARRLATMTSILSHATNNAVITPMTPPMPPIRASMLLVVSSIGFAGRNDSRIGNIVEFNVREDGTDRMIVVFGVVGAVCWHVAGAFDFLGQTMVFVF